MENGFRREFKRMNRDWTVEHLQSPSPCSYQSPKVMNKADGWHGQVGVVVMHGRSRKPLERWVGKVRTESAKPEQPGAAALAKDVFKWFKMAPEKDAPFTGVVWLIGRVLASPDVLATSEI
ncbi:hypothetical protein OIV83_006502, partial [Microbotryomycetes sp. JL201]